MVMHSVGGILGSNAIEGLRLNARGVKEGGVVKLVFLTAAVFPEGFKHGPLPFMEFDVRSNSPFPLRFYFVHLTVRSSGVAPRHN